MPHKPGVYLMKDRRAQVIYVGKAKDLNKRIRQYAGGQDDRAFVALLEDLLEHIDVIITSNEREALILEAGLIKRYRPRFNVLLNDDKDLPQLRLDYREPWPRVELVRNRKKDGARYFGPYPSAQACRMTLGVLNRHFMLRTCRDAVFSNRSRPCLQYEIRRCLGPCVYAVDRELYLQHCRDAELFLSGKFETLRDLVEVRMLEASELMEFERAASYRDQLHAIDEVQASQKIVQKSPVNQDFWAYYGDVSFKSIVVMMVRFGRLQHLQAYEARDSVSDIDAILSQVMVHHYQSMGNYPSEIVLDVEFSSSVPLLSETIIELAERKLIFTLPQRGIKHALLETARANAQQQYEQRHQGSADILAKVQAELGLTRYPHRIECYDVSNLQGSQIVASMVVFVEGRLDPSRCRSFKVQSEGQDDFASLEEVITRRLRYLVEAPEDETSLSVLEQGFREFPDFLLIDGGHGQVSAAMKAVKSARLEGAFDVVGIGESRVQEGSGQNVLHSPERFYYPERRDPLILDQASDVVLLMAQIRDETHRRALGFHRKRRQVEGFKSRLDDIEGIGPKRKRRLLAAFGSLRELAKQSPETIAQAGGISLALARKIREVLGGREH